MEKMKWIIFNRNWGKDIKEREEVKKLKVTQEEIKKEEARKKLKEWERSKIIDINNAHKLDEEEELYLQWQ